MRWADVMQYEPIETAPVIPAPHRAGLWIVAIYFIFPAATGLLVKVLMQTGALTLPREQLDAMKDMPIWQSIVSYAILALNLTGGILVLSRYRVALPVLLVSAGIVVLNVLYLVARGLFPLPGVPVLVSLFPYPLLIAAIFYVFLLHRRGILYKRHSA